MHENALPPGTQLLNYRLDNVLGAGGFGITYKARDEHLSTTVAIKEYFPAALAMRTKEQTVVSRPETPDAAGYAWGRDRFKQEATALARLQHPNIVGVDYLFDANGTAYMSLDFVDGPTLSGWMRANPRPYRQDQLEGLLYPLLDALEVVHDNGLLHRDIAPKNIMLCERNDLMPVLIDFGAARQIVAAHSRTFAAILTPGYAPFEQYTPTGRDQGPWTDIYALAATLYQTIAGRTPKDAPERMLDDTSPRAVEVGAGKFDKRFLEAIDWGLRPRPNDRPQSIDAWRVAFEGSHPVSAEKRQSPADQKTWFWRQ